MVEETMNDSKREYVSANLCVIDVSCGTNVEKKDGSSKGANIF